MEIGRIFLAMTLLLVVTVTLTFVAGQRALEDNRAVLQTHSAIDTLEQTLSELKDAETGQRGYLLTGDASYLTPYNRAVATLPQSFLALDQLASAGFFASADIDELHRQGDEKLRELAHTIEVRGQSDGMARAVAIVKTDVGKATMDKIRNLVHRMAMQKEDDVARLARESVFSTYLRTIAYAVTTLVNLVFMAWAYRRIQGEIQRRAEARARLAREQQLTAVTLASIGDGVIVTDAAGIITFINRVAAELTGWRAEESIGQPCATVFKIVSETSRQPMANPVEKVLKTGMIQGLANHTLLIRKDGRELPIDDSGAPIAGSDGVIHGVVLVFRDFTERKLYEQNLRSAKEEAEAANIAKDNFLAVLSHELRTPLTPVLVTLTAWEHNNAHLPADLKDDVQTLRRCVELEARLIDDLLDLTRIIRGKLALNLEVVNVHSLLEAVVDMYRSELDAKSIRYVTALSAAQHFASADPGRLQQVFWNILKNAVKFTPAGGTIDISSANADDRLQIRFTDSGVGMTNDNLRRIFKPLEQGSEEIVRRYGGLGLGLSLSKAFVEAQGGSISASSLGPGTGSTFTISIPTTEASQSRQAGEPPRSSRREPAPNSLLRILLVEDHEDTARVLSRLLQRLGHTVRIAGTLAEGVAAAQEPFDLLISDIGLPDGTGYDLIRRLRQDGKANFPAVALTGFGMEDDIAMSREAGFTDHLTKPVNFQRLQLMVQKIAESRSVTP
jgi:PAS domain S-box-containing protein